jgi:hypothetical protein
MRVEFRDAVKLHFRKAVRALEAELDAELTGAEIGGAVARSGGDVGAALYHPDGGLMMAIRFAWGDKAAHIAPKERRASN